MIPRSIRSKTQILQTVNLIPSDLSDVEYYNLYLRLFKKIHPSSRRIYFYEIYYEKVKLLDFKSDILNRIFKFHEHYLVNLKKNKENYKLIKKQNKLKATQIENEAKKVKLNEKKCQLYKSLIQSQEHQTCKITNEIVESQNKKLKKRIENNRKKTFSKKSYIKIIYTGMTN